MTDIIERVETALAADREQCGWRPFVVELVVELKAAHAQIEERPNANIKLPEVTP